MCKSGKLGGVGQTFCSLRPNSCFFPSGQTIESNWRCGRHNLQRIQCRSENSKGVYCLQYDDEKIISGLRDNSIKVSISLCLFPGCEWGSALGAACASLSLHGTVAVCGWWGWDVWAWRSPHLHSALEAWSTARDYFHWLKKCSLKLVFPWEGEVSVCYWLWLWLFHCQDYASMLILPGTSLADRLKGRTRPTHGADSLLMESLVFLLSSKLWQCSSLGSMFLMLINHLPFLFLTDLGQNKLGMFESINRTYWLSSLSAIWWKSYCNWIFRFYSEVSVKFLHKNKLSIRAGNIFNNL